jgi:2-oxoglutarate dehydrogenase E2 component (dihydrolipoamide succinyltransferase)
MPIELKIPHIGESINEVQIAEWLKADGDEVKKDENLAVIDSEKTTLELPSPENGRLKILHQAGETVRVGEIVAHIEPGNGATETPKAPETKTDAAGAEKKAAPVEARADEAKTDNKTDKKAASSPAKKTEAREPKKEILDNDLNIAKAAAPATLPEKENEGETEKATVEPKKKTEPPKAEVKAGKTNGEAPAASKPEEAKAPPSPPQTSEAPPATPEAAPPAQETRPPETGGEKIVPMTMLRRTVAKRLVEAKREMAMLTTFNEVDMSAVQSLRKEHQENFEKRYQVKLGFMSFFVKAVISALKQFPQLNAEIRENDIVYHKRFDIGVAIAGERGLVVPVLRNAEKMTFAEIEKAISDFAKRSREGKLKPSELEGGTFTITNGGVFGSLLSTPIINPPQSGILGMHSIQERPIALNGQVVIRPMMFIALTYDHRLVDGREAVLFLRGVKDAIDTPARMLMEI